MSARMKIASGTILAVFPMWVPKGIMAEIKKSNLWDKGTRHALTIEETSAFCKRQVLFPKKRHLLFPKCGKLFSLVCGILFSRIYAAL